MHLGNLGTHDARATQGDQDVSNEHGRTTTCAIAWKGYKAGKGAGKKRPYGAGSWYRGKGADEWTSDKKDDGGKKGGKIGSKVNKPDWYGDKDKGSSGNKRQRERERQKQRQRQERDPMLLRLRRARAHRSEFSTQMDQQHRRGRRQKFIVGK